MGRGGGYSLWKGFGFGIREILSTLIKFPATSDKFNLEMTHFPVLKAGGMGFRLLKNCLFQTIVSKLLFLYG